MVNYRTLVAPPSPARLDVARQWLREAQAALISGTVDGVQDNGCYTELTVAALHGGETIHERLRNGSDVNGRGPGDRTALMFSAMIGDLLTARVLLDNGADPLLKDRWGNTARDIAGEVPHTDMVDLLTLAERDWKLDTLGRAISDAARRGDDVMVQRLLEEGHSVNVRGPWNWTPLIAAAQENRVGVVRLLLASGADVNARDEDGYTALMYAAMEGHCGVMEELIKAGSDVDAKTTVRNYTALMEAAWWGRLSAVVLLLAAGANPFLERYDGLTARDKAKTRRFGRRDVVSVLEAAEMEWSHTRNQEKTVDHPIHDGAPTEVNAPVNPTPPVAESSMIAATTLNRIKAARQPLREAQATIARTEKTNGSDSEGSNGWTSLAIGNYNLDELFELLMTGADVNMTGVGGRTPLIAVAVCGHMAFASLLLAAGADPLISTQREGTALDIAWGGAGRLPHVDLIDLLTVAEEEWTSGNNTYNAAQQDGCLRAARHRLRDAEATVARSNLRDADGWTPLTHAAFHNQIDRIVPLLLDGEDVNGRGLNEKTPLMFAAQRGWMTCVRLLLASGADPLLTDQVGNTAKSYAQRPYYPRGDMAELLALAETGRRHVDQGLMSACREVILVETAPHRLSDLPLPPAVTAYLQC